MNENAVPGPLAGLRVLDAATLFAGPLAATFLGDLGADVIKIEHPRRPDAARGHGPARDGVNLWWKTLGRNKRTITLDLSTPEGADLLAPLWEALPRSPQLRSVLEQDEIARAARDAMLHPDDLQVIARAR